MERPTLHQPWWATFKRPAPSLRLFCFPYGGASALVYYNFVRDLPPEIELWSAQLPGRGWRSQEAPFSRMEPLLDALGPALPIDVPFAFFGHSLGAAIATGLCDWLAARNLPQPRHLFASGRRAPQFSSGDFLHTLPDAEFVEGLKARYNGVPEIIARDPALMAFFLPAIRADLAISELWSRDPSPPLPLPVTAFAGQDDPAAPAHEVEAWSAQTQRPFSFHLMPGDHFFLRVAQPEILRVVTRELLR
jgi:surfactin synthase thioesterase subunit